MNCCRNTLYLFDFLSGLESAGKFAQPFPNPWRDWVGTAGCELATAFDLK
jgi:hypothetical protein